MRSDHVLLCYLGSAEDDRLLREIVEQCGRSGSKLSIVFPVVDAAVPDGCCGIQADQWRRLIDEDTRDAAQRVVDRLDSFGCHPVSVAIEVGPSVRQIARTAAVRTGCDVLAVARKRGPWSSGLSRRQLRHLRRDGACEILELRSNFH